MARFQWPNANHHNSQSLPFAKVKHQVSTLDAQPVEGGGIIILVTGALLVSYPASKRVGNVVPLRLRLFDKS
jgi:hypothetical protein